MEASGSPFREAHILQIPPNLGGNILCVPRLRQHPTRAFRERPFSARERKNGGKAQLPAVWLGMRVPCIGRQAALAPPSCSCVASVSEDTSEVAEIGFSVVAGSAGTSTVTVSATGSDTTAAGMLLIAG